VGERSPDGLTEDDVLLALAELDADGLVDYVSVVAGTSETLAGSDHIVPPMGTPTAYLAPLGRRVKQVVAVPVMIAGRIVAPQDAEAVLAAGDADATVMTRALICDPLLPEKAAVGDVEGIRACIGCNQACIGHFHAGYPISCVQRPETGRELEYGALRPATTRRRVVVVGGGPGGMKAAAVAAQRGHHVTLLEAGSRLGGPVLLAEELPGREEFGGAATNLVTEIARAGVEVRLGEGHARGDPRSSRPTRWCSPRAPGPACPHSSSPTTPRW
jgi:NADPH-dependent 2,4-dienoyl-CoA reductase/sulfur reductase-like enzyme